MTGIRPPRPAALPAVDLRMAGFDGRFRAATNRQGRSTNVDLQPSCDIATLAVMGLIVIFFLGVANFAMHRAVLESGHPMLGQFSVDRGSAARRLTLLFEFVILLAAMLLVHHGYTLWGWAYAAYSALNGLAAWLILSRRI